MANRTLRALRRPRAAGAARRNLPHPEVRAVARGERMSRSPDATASLEGRTCVVQRAPRGLAPRPQFSRFSALSCQRRRSMCDTQLMARKMAMPEAEIMMSAANMRGIFS